MKGLAYIWPTHIAAAYKNRKCCRCQTARLTGGVLTDAPQSCNRNPKRFRQIHTHTAPFSFQMFIFFQDDSISDSKFYFYNVYDRTPITNQFLETF